MNQLPLSAVFMVAAMFLQADAWAQTSYLRNAPIGSSDAMKPQTSSICPFRELSQCVGERFMFVPMSPKLREFGYIFIQGGQDRLGRVSYEEGVGRIGIIEAVQANGRSLEVKLRMTDNGQVYVGEAFNGRLDGLVPLRDIDSARVNWVGRSYYYCDDELATDPTGNYEIEFIHVRQYRPMHVLDVVVSHGITANTTPARLIVRTEDGTEGFVDVAVSGTNVSGRIREFGHFDHYFMEVDPRTIYKWPDEIWTIIEDHKVAIGMTKEQVKMSWGEPATINKTLNASGRSEQWVYNSGSYVYLDNGVVAAIQGSE